ncbi:MAG: diguanylate cyclase, partial [Candidatus Eisenbacteria sp.]|nr:diguanylate cyclase [Candidatus Eisenbacteria bacterium]
MIDSASSSTRRKILIVAADDRAGERLARWIVDSGYHLVRYNEVRRLVEMTVEEHPDLVVVSLEGMNSDDQAKMAALCSESEVPAPTLVLTKDGDGMTGSIRGECSLDWMDEATGPEKFLTRVRAMLRVASDTHRDPGAGKRDQLTKVYNRRYFDERLDMEIERARRYGRKVSCVMVDIDEFKKVNTTHGHQAGDGVLKILADVLLSSTRTSDVVSRYGGEEFVVIVPEAAGNEAAVLAERLRRTFEDCGVCFGEGEPVVTVSCGVATYPDHASDSATLLRMVDSAVFRAKSEGRNRCVVAFSETDDGFESEGSTAGRILLVEDDDYDRSIASLVLRASGYEVLEATDGELGVSLAKSAHPDLVIVDLQLTGMSGLEATRQIIQMEEMKDIPVVALTTADMPDNLRELARVGCRGYITKPIDTNVLASQVP